MTISSFFFLVLVFATPFFLRFNTLQLCYCIPDAENLNHTAYLISRTCCIPIANKTKYVDRESNDSQSVLLCACLENKASQDLSYLYSSEPELISIGVLYYFVSSVCCVTISLKYDISLNNTSCYRVLPIKSTYMYLPG